MAQTLTVAFVLGIGGLLALQGAINSRLATYMNHPLQAALISFSVGTLSLLLINLFLSAQWPSWHSLIKTPPYLWIGGLFGAIMVSSAIIFIPQIGATSFIAAIIVGQLIMAVVVDHYGILGVPVDQVDWLKILGIGLLLLGFLCIRR
jgi:transporter family-2 protein